MTDRRGMRFVAGHMLALALCVTASPVQAASPVLGTVTGTRIFIRDQCAVTDVGNFKENTLEILPLLAGLLASTVISAGTNALGSALTNAGTSHAISTQAQSPVRWYTLPDIPANGRPALNAVFRYGNDAPGCLIFVTGKFGDSTMAAPPATIFPVVPFELSNMDNVLQDDDTIAKNLRKLGLIGEPDVYAEFIISKYVTGTYAIRPILFWNRAPKASGIVTFDIGVADKPAPAGGQAPTVGGRLTIGRIEKGVMVGPDGLKIVLAPLPLPATAADPDLAILSAEADIVWPKPVVAPKLVQAPPKALPAKPGAKGAKKGGVALLQPLAVPAAAPPAQPAVTQAQFQADYNKAKTSGFGASVLTVTYTVTTDDKPVLKALGTAISGKAADAGTDVSNAITASGPSATDFGTYYASLPAAVLATDKYNAAVASGASADDQLAAQQTMITAKAAANSAAKTVRKPEPYPDVGS